MSSKGICVRLMEPFSLPGNSRKLSYYEKIGDIYTVEEIIPTELGEGDYESRRFIGQFRILERRML